MKTRILASTKVGYELPIEEAINFSGKEAGICYMPDTIDTILQEPEEKTMKRANGNMSSNHHSVFGHVQYNFVFEEIPKIMAMVLNNEGIYCTSEKSARYTKMQPSEEERVLYEKWIEIYKRRIHEVYPNIEEKQAQKLAQENARYLISVFTPATVMGHSISFQQFSYLLHFMEDFVQKEEDTDFNKLLKPYLQEFVEMHSKFKVEGINPDSKNRKLSLFSDIDREDEWGENYCTSYWASFAQLAQAQRHRTLSYEINTSSLEQNLFFIPPIIKRTSLEDEWLKDIVSLSQYYPQGKMVLVNERGTVENFVLKCKERLCGCAQLEIAMQTELTLDRYLINTREKNSRVYNYLQQYATGARCTFADYNCAKPCIWGAKKALDRMV
jgi:thymidylate synthase ThyX